MQKIIDLSHEEAKKHFLKGSSYFNADMPNYIKFETILNEVDSVLNGNNFTAFKKKNPLEFSGVNYNFLSNKDGNFAWRPLELIHPAVFISLVDLLCSKDNWGIFQKRFSEFRKSCVECCSDPMISLNEQSDKATQIRSWWQQVEQRSIIYSLEFSHILHTDVTDCYGSLYTHSIAWALHGFDQAKANKNDNNLLGNKIDFFIRVGRYGQTNGISQGSVLMDFIAELVLGYVDERIHSKLKDEKDFRILRYRDDYRIFTNSDNRAEEILQIISSQLQFVGMKLGVSKTFLAKNVIEASIKPDKLAGIELQDLGTANAQTIQKQLLRLHSFGQRFPNSGALRRLISMFHKDISSGIGNLDNIEVLIAIATDIGFVSPATFPAIAAILSYLMFQVSDADEKKRLWKKVYDKMSHVPYNGYLEIWLQRVTRTKGIDIRFHSKEPLCKIANNEVANLWNNEWISSKDLLQALKVSKIVVGEVSDSNELVEPEEIELFTENAWLY